MMLAVRVPDVANAIIASQACSSVYWCKSSVAWFGVVIVLCGIRVDKCNSARTLFLVLFSSGENSPPIISLISRSVNCFIVVNYIK